MMFDSKVCVFVFGEVVFCCNQFGFLLFCIVEGVVLVEIDFVDFVRMVFIEEGLIFGEVGLIFGCLWGVMICVVVELVIVVELFCVVVFKLIVIVLIVVCVIDCIVIEWQFFQIFGLGLMCEDVVEFVEGVEIQ